MKSRIIDTQREPGIPLDQWEDKAAAKREEARRAPKRKEVTEDGGRYCSECGEFLGSTCDPFGRTECGSKCHADDLES